MTPQEKLLKLKAAKDPMFAAQLETSAALSDALKRVQTFKGDPGYTPVKGKDYFTSQEISSIISVVQSEVKDGQDGKNGKDGFTPVKGKDYRDGVDGVSPNPELIVQTVLKRIPKPKDGVSPKIEDIVSSVTGEIKKQPLDENLVTKSGLIEFLRRGGFRGGGGGATQNLFSSIVVSGQPTVTVNSPTTALTLVAGTNVTLTTDNTAKTVTISATGGSGSGTVTSVSVVTANGISGSVATATTTPAITLTLGAITPTSVNSVVLSGSSTPTLAVTGTTTVSGANTGDQNIFSSIVVSGQTTVTANSATTALTLIAGTNITLTTDNTGKTVTINATSSGSGTVTSVASADGSITVTNPTTTVDLAVVKAPKLTTARTIGGVSFDGTANITVASATGGFTVSGGDLALGANNLTLTGSIGSTGSRVLKGWFTDLQVTNAIVGSITGNATTVTTNANLTGVITSVGNATSIASQTGTGTKFVVDTSPTLVTPVLGIATATTINKVTITAPATGSTLTIQDGFTLTANANATVSGTNTGDQNIFASVVVSGQTTVTANSTSTALTLVAGTNVTITTDNTAKSVTINATSAVFPFTDVTGTTQAAAVNNGYIADNAGLVTITLPTTAAIGDMIPIVGKGSGGWKVAQNASQLIHFGNQVTTTGTGGSLASVNQWDCVDLICVTANTTWVVKSSIGNITIV